MHTYRLTPTRRSSRRYGQSALNLCRLLADAHLPTRLSAFVAILVVDLGEWFVRPDQPGGRVGILQGQGFIDHIVIASLALISSGLSRQNEILNRVRLF